MSVKLLTEHHLEFLSLKGVCSGSSESTHVKIPHCWKSHAAAQIVLVSKFVKYVPNVYTALLLPPATGSNNHTSPRQTPSNLDINKKNWVIEHISLHK